MTPGKLTVAPDGRVTGHAVITHNRPFPCVNGSWGSGAIQGVTMHTMVCNLPLCIDLFNEPRVQASAHFGIAQDGRIHQFGPIGKGWIAWAQVAGNAAWYSIEHADDGDQHHPLTDAQITASAQLVELLSRFAGFPLQVTDDIHGRGYGTHVMGGTAWGGHTCPGPGPRAGQRHAIIELAKVIRAGHPEPAPEPVPHEATIVTEGRLSLAAIAAWHGTRPMHILHLTCDHFGGFPPEVAAWGNDVFAGRIDAQADVPAGLKLRVPVVP